MNKCAHILEFVAPLPGGHKLFQCRNCMKIVSTYTQSNTITSITEEDIDNYFKNRKEARIP